jgi:hypothetical protein
MDGVRGGEVKGGGGKKESSFDRTRYKTQNMTKRTATKDYNFAVLDKHKT